MPTLRFDPKLPIIPIQVVLEGGEKSFKVNLILDTGASLTLISRSVANLLKLIPSSRKKVEVSTVSQVEKVPLVVVPKISFLDLEAYNVECLVKNLPPADDFVEGLLGLSFLKNFELRIDFRKGVLELK